MAQLPATRARTGLPGRACPGCYRRRGLTLVVWTIGLACLVTLWTRFGAGYDNNFSGSDPGQAVLGAHFHRQSGDQLTLAIRSSQPISSAAVRARVDAALPAFERAAGVTSVASPYQMPGQISREIGLGVGVDYALFIVTRFREALRSGSSPLEAVGTAMSTAGRSVLFAGVTVTIGMLGLLVLRMPLLNGVAIAASATVAMTVLGSLTLLPALLGFTGTRLARPSRFRLRRAAGRARPGVTADPAGGETGRNKNSSRPAAQRWAALIQRRPVIAAVLSAAAILVLAAPALGMKLSMPDESAEARGTMGYASYATMAKGFGPGFDAPLIVAATLPHGAAGADTSRLAAAVRATPGVAAVTPVRVSPDGARPRSGTRPPPLID